LNRHINLSIVIPAYNEAQRLPKTLKKILPYLAKKKIEHEIIIVDDASKDNTSKLVRSFILENTQIRLLSNRKNRGKGGSIRRGIAAARGEIILFSDADLSTPIEEMEKLLLALEQGADIAIASRGIKGARIAISQPWYRTFMGKTFNFLVRSILIPNIYDTQCGFKLFRRKLARKIFLLAKTSGFGFDMEILYLAKKSGAKMKEVPVVWEDNAASKVSPLRDSFCMFWDIFRIKLRHK